MNNGNRTQGAEKFQAVDAEVQRLHQLYFDLVHKPPELTSEEHALAELESASESGSDGADGGIAVAEASVTETTEFRSDPHVKAERELLRRETAQVVRQRVILAVFNLIAAALLCAGGSLILGELLGKRFGVSVPAVVYLLLFSVLMSALSWKVARAIQIVKESRRQPIDIPYLACLARSYQIEYLRTLPEDVIQAQLANKLQQWYLIRVGNVTTDEALVERNVYCALALALIVGFTALNAIKYGVGTADDALISVCLALVLAILFLATIVSMANVALRLPILEEHNEEEILRQNMLKQSKDVQAVKVIEEKRKLLLVKRSQEAQREEKERARARTRREIHVNNRTTLKNHKADLKTVVFQLKRATDNWERLRGFTEDEYMSLQGEKAHQQWATWLLRGFAMLLVVLATYPASITTSEIFSIPYLYVEQIRVAPMFWLIWIVLMIVVELVLVPSVAGLAKIDYARGVLEEGYQEQERRLGHRYFIYSYEEAGKLRKSAWRSIGIAIMIVFLEFLANLYYMLHFSDVDQLTAFFLALVTFFGLLGLTIPLAHNYYALDWIYLAIGRQRQLAPVRHAAPAVSRYQGYKSESAEALKRYQSKDYIDPSGK